MRYDTLPGDEIINRTVSALGASGISVQVVANKDEARVRVLSLLPQGSEVMTMSSETLNQTGIALMINESPDYVSVRKKLTGMKRETQGREMQVKGAAPECAVGSAQVVTEKGELIFASNTGSQLPAYAYGSDKVILVVGVQKIVANLETAMKRLYEYVLPLESERAHKAYGVAASNVSKILIINKEVIPGRIQLILVKERLGF